MPPVLNFPGVYIEELPSAVHTITGVATSIAAFAGWAPEGPTDRAALALSFADFQNQFGGLDSRSYLGYAVNQFFANGGQQAFIIRVVWDGSLTAATGTTPTAAGTSSATVGASLPLFARSPGLWGDDLRITVALAADPTRFSIQVGRVVNGNTIVLENFFNLSTTSTDPHFVVAVIDSDSRYITFVDPATGTAPATISATPTAASATPLTGGAEGSVLTPLDGVNGDGNFELALGADPAATGNTFGIHLLDRVDIFNLLCVPGETDAPTIQNLQAYCRANERSASWIAPRTKAPVTLRARGRWD